MKHAILCASVFALTLAGATRAAYLVTKQQRSDPETGELREDVWARWLALDPVQLVDQYADNLKQLRLLFIDCGSRDEFNLQFGARILVRKLRALGVPHDYEEFDDGHMNIQYRYEVSLPKVVGALQVAE